MFRIFILAAVLHSCLCGTISRGQAKLDKAQIEQNRGVGTVLVLYRPHLYGASHLEAFQKPRRKADRLPHGAGQANRLADAAGSRQPRAQRRRVFCGGNGSLGLDLEPIARSARFDADAFLFVDYPGYGGLCSGKPSPRSIRENVKESVLAAAKQTGIDPRDLPDKGCVFGHSLGCAAALLAVEEFHLRAVVLCAPFTSTADMVQLRFGIPKTFPLQHPFDNRAGLQELARNHGRALSSTVTRTRSYPWT